MSLSDNFSELLDLIGQLQANATLRDSLRIRLPEIVVIGDQSSGKSSLLESLTGVALPRGKGTVTRTPILIRQKTSPDVRFTVDGDVVDGSLVEKAISDRTETLTKDDLMKMSDQAITVTVEGPNVLELNLVDLPGIIHSVGDNDHPDLPHRIETMLRKRIGSEDCIILCVIPGTSELAHNHALTLAKQVDPKRERTIGVITMVDLEAATQEHAEMILRAESADYPLKHGFFPVRNRTAEELKRRAPRDEVRAKEAAFFETSHWNIFNKKQPRCGTDVLNRKLCELLKDKVQAWLGPFAKLIQEKEAEQQQALKQLPAAVQSVPEARRMYAAHARELTDYLRAALRDASTASETMDAPIASALYNLMLKFGAAALEQLPASDAFADGDVSGYATTRIASEAEEAASAASTTPARQSTAKAAESPKTRELYDGFKAKIPTHLGGQLSLPDARLDDMLLHVIREYVAQVSKAADTLIADTRRSIGEFLQQAIKRQFADHTAIMRLVDIQVDKELTAIMEKVQDRIHHQLQRETCGLFTVTDVYHTTLTQLRSLPQQLKHVEAELQTADEESPHYNALTVRWEHLARQVRLFPTEGATPLQHSAWEAVLRCHAYAKVVAPRLIDGLCVDLRYGVHEELLCRLRVVIETEILDTYLQGEQGRQLMCPDEDMQRRMEEAQGALRHLQQIRERLTRLRYI